MNTKTKKAAAHPAPVTEPVWLRIAEVQRIYGIKRTTIYEMMDRGEIKTASLKQPGNRHGIRLIHSASLAARIEEAK